MFEVIELGGMKTVSTKSACNHVYVVDVSGSMYNDLPAIRQHLKNIISVVAQPDDTFSVIYFSGKGQCGVVFENVLVSDASTVTMMHNAIDRYLTTIGLTGFIDPIQKSLTLNLDSSKVNNFIMMTDGSDNTSKRSDIIDQVVGLKDKYASIAFIEYGYYADRDLITKMADVTDGVHIFAEGIVNYETALESLVSSVSRVESVDVKVNKKAKHCVFISGGQIKIVNVVDGIASVPETVERVYSIVPSDVLSKQLSEDHLYLVLYYAAKTNNHILTLKCLQAIGDVKLFNMYDNAFTKQELSRFESAVESATLNVDDRFTEGKDLNLATNKDTKTIIDLLKDLSEVPNTSLVVSSPLFDYKRTTRKSDAVEMLPRFIPSPVAQVSLNSLTFNSSRPNVSISTTVKGMVELPENDFGLKHVSSFITRNYTIIKDGIRNMSKLPVTVPEASFDKFVDYPHDILEISNGFVYVVFDLNRIPVINRFYVETVDLSRFALNAQIIESTKAELKVLNHLLTESGDSSKISELIELYGEDCAQWLSTVGVRNYGFSPVGTKSVEVTDQYESIQVDYKIKGLSSLPSIKAVNDKIDANKKLNLGDTLIKEALEDFSGVDVETLRMKRDSRLKLKRSVEALMAIEVYALVLGRTWYTDSDVVTTQVLLTNSQQSVDMTIEKSRKLIKI